MTKRVRLGQGVLSAAFAVVVAMPACVIASCGGSDGGAGSDGNDATAPRPTTTTTSPPAPTPTSTSGPRDPRDADTADAEPVTPVAPLWTMALGSGAAHAVAVAPNGNAVIAASEFVASKFDDIVVMEVTPSGAPVWTKKYGGTGQEHGGAVAVDESGDVYVAGKLGSASVDFSGGVVASGLVAGREYGYVARLDGATGAGKWVRVFRGTGPVYVEHVAARGGRIAIAGRYDGTLTYDASGGGTKDLAPHATFRSAFFGSLDATTGLASWVIGVGGSGSGAIGGEGVALDVDGDVLGATSFSDSSLLGLGAPRARVGASQDFVLVRLAAANGSPKYVRQIGKAQNPSGAVSLRASLDGTGPLRIAGLLRGDLDFGMGTLSSGSGRDGIFLAFDPASGATTAQKKLGGEPSDEYGTAFRAAAATGDVLASGTYQSSSSNPTPPPVIEGRLLPDPRGTGTFVVRYGADARARWVRAVVPSVSTQTHSSVQATDLAALPSGTIVLVGSVFGTVDLGDGKPLTSDTGVSRGIVWAWPP